MMWFDSTEATEIDAIDATEEESDTDDDGSQIALEGIPSSKNTARLPLPLLVVAVVRGCLFSNGSSPSMASAETRRVWYNSNAKRKRMQAS
mmetsp:Transcript_7683/g.18520  ORF Transcript_7683/g.18520 Transcript_7683/m.18520 type:complete len:91 (-) Transcript_7683:7-279(-)